MPTFKVLEQTKRQLFQFCNGYAVNIKKQNKLIQMIKSEAHREIGLQQACAGWSIQLAIGLFVEEGSEEKSCV